jgi:hypothetical protein
MVDQNEYQVNQKGTTDPLKSFISSQNKVVPIVEQITEMNAQILAINSSK